MTEEIINLKDYFVHHYDDWGRLYCVEFKGSPLELENNIIRLEQENRELKEKYAHVLELAKLNADSNEYCLQELEKKYEQLRSALEEIREIAENAKEGRYATKSEDYTEGMRIIGCYVLDKINEVLGDEI